ncbi:hypothetical protein [Kitasatospora sp. NPDC004531]
MKSKLGKAVVTSLAALALTGIGAPAYADIVAGGGGGQAFSAEEPFLAEHGMGFAATDHLFAAGGGFEAATATELTEGGGGVAAIG